MKSFNTREISHRTCHIIRDERLARDLTQIEMAGELGISQSALVKDRKLGYDAYINPMVKLSPCLDFQPIFLWMKNSTKAGQKSLRKKEPSLLKT